MLYATYYAFLGVTSPWWGPNRTLEKGQPVGTARATRFADYPYADGAKGNLLRPQRLVYGWDGITRNRTGDAVTPRLVQSTSFRLGVETGFGLHDGINRLGFHARLQLPLRLQFDTDWSRLRERDQEGVDVAWIGREHVSVRFAETNTIQFYTGLGVQHFCDATDCVHGIDTTWGFEAFPGKPVTLAFEGSIGNLDQTFAPGLRTKLGYLVGPIEASLGWHQRWVGGVPLGGPFIGLSAWF